MMTAEETRDAAGECPTENYSIATHNGYLTLVNPATGNHRTFRIRTQPADSDFAPGQRVVSLLVGPNNGHDYMGFGFVQPDGTIRLWKRFCEDSVFAVYCDMLTNPRKWQERHNIAYMNESHCRRCNRLLTTPDSIARGIGPECAGREAEGE